MKYKAIIFDNDGTLVDTEPIHLEARQNVLKRHDIYLSREEYITHWIGRPPAAGAAFTCGMMTVEKLELIVRQIDAEYHRLREEKLTLIPGVKFLLHNLLLRFTLAIATVLPRKSVERGLELVLREERKSFSVIVSGEEVQRNKPAPDVFLVTAERLGVAPGECIVIEDSITGVTSAKAAGMCCIARASEWTSAQELYDAGADVVCRDYGILANLLVS